MIERHTYRPEVIHPAKATRRLGPVLPTRMTPRLRPTHSMEEGAPDNMRGRLHHGDGMMAKVQTLTLDTSCVIAAVQQPKHAGAVEPLTDEERAGQVKLWLTAAFVADQTRASSEHLQANLAWLAGLSILQAPRACSGLTTPTSTAVPPMSQTAGLSRLV